MTASKAAPAARWYHVWRQAGRVPAETDPADHGTAFGMEMSLLDPPATSLPPPPRNPWMPRWAARRRACP